MACGGAIRFSGRVFGLDRCQLDRPAAEQSASGDGWGPVVAARVLERIDVQDLPKRLPELRQRGLPAIVVGLFRHNPIELARARPSARELLRNVPVSVGPNYVDANLERVRRFLRGAPMPRRMGRTRSTFGAYLDLVGDRVGVRQVISEEPAPAELLDGIDLSPLDVDGVVSGNVDPYAVTSPDTAYALFFVAGLGNSSDLHTDGDGRDVVLYQGFGRKRVCLVPSSSAALVHPVAGFATVRLAAMSDGQRRAFLDYAGGWEHELLPGEALFMPAFIWHHFDYLEVSLSVAFRFGGVEDPLARELIRRVHLDQHTQAIIVATRDPDRADAGRRAAQRVLDAAGQRYWSASAKYRAVREVSVAAAQEVMAADPDRRLGGFIEVEDFLAGGLSGFYSTSPDGPSVTRRWWQRREFARDQVRRRARQLAYWA